MISCYIYKLPSKLLTASKSRWLGYSNLPTLASARLWSSSWSAAEIDLANITHEEASTLYKLSLNDPNKFWGDFGRSKLKWMKEFHTVNNSDMHSGKHEWFIGGKLNVSGRDIYELLVIHYVYML